MASLLPTVPPPFANRFGVGAASTREPDWPRFQVRTGVHVWFWIEWVKIILVPGQPAARSSAVKERDVFPLPRGCLEQLAGKSPGMW